MQSVFDCYKVENVSSGASLQTGSVVAAGSSLPLDTSAPCAPAATTAPVEEWRIIPGYDERYEVSDKGRIRSRMAHRSRGTTLPAARVLYGHNTAGGYHCVYAKTEDGNLCSLRVHQAVLLAFVGPRPPGMECRHLDGNPKNNRADNLAWGTHAENMHDMVTHGRARRGAGPITRLRLWRAAADLSDSDVVRLSGVPQQTYSAIERGVVSPCGTTTNWTHDAERIALALDTPCETLWPQHVHAPTTAEDLGVAVSDLDGPDFYIRSSDRSSVIRDVLSGMRQSDREILVARFGLDGGNEQTLEEIAKVRGCTRERIRQIEARAFRCLRHWSRSRLLAEVL